CARSDYYGSTRFAYW
nr:immunoglobulin heavy chain junction region [Mus musculus]MBK4198673.1 immunoglobulin heavy chain junction region [Mus musculus]